MIPAGVKTQDEVKALPLEQRGDCMRASFASILELDLDDVPNFIEAEDWWGTMRDFLAQWGLEVAVRSTTDFAPWRGLYIVGGQSPRGEWGHMAIGEYDSTDRTWRVVWDPHPSRAGFRDGLVKNAWELRVFDPGRLPLHVA